MADITVKQLVDALTHMTKTVYAVYQRSEQHDHLWVITGIFNSEAQAYAFLNKQPAVGFVQKIEQECSPTWF